ncbi:aspartate kinase [Candidatus Uhrbacteria bacterium]|nr:aspartate kinase [Candidatus Uhrbacteria bacterium]
MIVMKFGGTSVGNAAAIKQVAGLVSKYADRKPVVTVSALSGVTDQLLALARAAGSGDGADPEAEIARLRERHLVAVREAVDDEEMVQICGEQISKMCAELLQVLRGVALLRELSGRSTDLIVSFGERLAAPAVAAAVASAGPAAGAVDARMLIETDDRFTSANVRFEATNRKIRAVILPMIRQGVIPVVTGFIGATSEGITTTLGRGGSDYTVAILAGALDAEEIWLWKEVDGVMTADPNLVPDAAVLAELSYDEAAEMSYFGAKVIHPKTMIPAVQRGIPIRLRNTFRPEAPGTVIGTRTGAAPLGAKAVTAAKKLAVAAIEGKGMSGIAGFAAQVFGAAGRHGINIVMFSQSSSEQTICLVIESKDAAAMKTALEEELREEVRAGMVERITVEEGMAAVAVVGDGMRGSTGVAARVFGAVAEAGVNIRAIAQGSSERNISFVISEADVAAAVRSVHRAFALHELRAKISV